MSEIVIRRFRPDDRAHWGELWEGYNEFYERTVEPRVTERLWSRLLENESEPYGFAAELDGKVVGLTHYFPVFSTSDWDPRLYLQDLYADSRVRGRGVGRKLIEAVYAHADEMGLAQVYWLTQDFNHTARRLYDRVGQVTPFIKYQR